MVIRVMRSTPREAGGTDHHALPNERCSRQALFGGALCAQLLDVLAAELGR
jgi:hypothetical protein